MTANGPAIWGGCVTRRSIRSRSRYPPAGGPQSCHGARRVWRGFCHPGTKFISITRVAVQVWSEPVNCHGTGFLLWALAQCRGTNCLGTRKLSRCRIYIECRWACPDASFGRICHGSRVLQKQWQATYPYCPCYKPLYFKIIMQSKQLSLWILRVDPQFGHFLLFVSKYRK